MPFGRSTKSWHLKGEADGFLLAGEERRADFEPGAV
jgi:hypothetical protein